MCEFCINTEQKIKVESSYDPTHTTALRNLFTKDIKRRFTALERLIKKAVVDLDVFGLQRLEVNEMRLPNREQFAFARSEAKITAFIKWLEEQIEAGIIDVRDIEQVGKGIEGAWTNRYLFDSYKRGVIRARYEMKKAGYKIPSIDETGGIEVTMSTPFHIDAIGVLYTRVFSDLKGITSAMDMQISRILSQGIADGDNPRLLAKKLLATINGNGVGDLSITDSLGRFIPAKRRAEMLARTEIIRAHHVATINEYKNWAVEGVIVKAEWRTAGDQRVCPTCASFQGAVFTLDQAMNMIPAHPFCRCCVIPFVVK